MSFDFLYKFLETSLILRRIKHDIALNVRRPPSKVPFFLSDLNELEFAWQILEKSSYIKFNEIPSSGSQADPCRQTDWLTEWLIDRSDESNSIYSQFRGCA